MRHDLTTGSIRGLIIRLAWPTALAMSLETVFGIVDAAFINRFSQEAFSAVTLVFPVNWVLFGLSAIIGIGTTSVVARRLGAGDTDRANSTAGHSFVMALVLGIVIPAVAIAGHESFFRLLVPRPGLLPYVSQYATWAFAGAFWIFLYATAGGILRAQGDMKTPMVVMLFGVALNTVLDPILIFGWGPVPRLGVSGAAMATYISRGLGCVLLYVLLFRHRGGVRLRVSGFPWQWDRVRDIVVVGIPASANQLVMAFGSILIMVILRDFGETAIAAYGYVGRLHGIVILPCLGIAMAVMAIVGQNVGAGLYERVEKTAWTAALYAAVMMEIVGVAFFAVPRLWLGLFGAAGEGADLAVSCLRITSLTYMFIGVSITLGSAFQGAGKAVPALVVTLLRLVVIAVPGAYLLSRVMGVNGVWVAMAASTIIASLVSALWFRSGAWKPADAR